mgnify:CR=1 FL=1
MMKKKLLSFMMLMSTTVSMNAAVHVDRIEPTDWYVGMKDASLQLMVYGKDVRNADVDVQYPGVRIDSQDWIRLTISWYISISMVLRLVK